MSAPGILIAAPASGSGKTTLTLALLRALRRGGRTVGAFKVGPDYLDPMLHARACGRPAVNLDSWAMRIETLAGLGDQVAAEVDLVLGEGVMGLFDGAADGQGSTADLASLLDLPVILVVDARGMARLGRGAGRGLHAPSRRRRDRRGDASTTSPAPSTRRCCGAPATTASRSRCWPACRAIRSSSCRRATSGWCRRPRCPSSRSFLERAAEIVGARTDLERLVRLARPFGLGLYGPPPRPLRPLGQRIAVARDIAFAFAYRAVLDGWRVAGAEVLPFSPLADEAPDPAADAVYLPGGYPELHAGRLAANAGFLAGLPRGRGAQRLRLWRVRRLHGARPRR